MYDIINLSNSVPLTTVHDSITNKETILCEKIGHVQQNVFVFKKFFKYTWTYKLKM